MKVWNLQMFTANITQQHFIPALSNAGMADRFVFFPLLEIDGDGNGYWQSMRCSSVGFA
jgi:hypothetical protein